MAISCFPSPSLLPSCLFIAPVLKVSPVLGQFGSPARQPRWPKNVMIFLLASQVESAQGKA